MTTTIKVTTETRDRLKAQASVAGTSLGEHLARLADLADRHERLESLRVAIATTPADQAEERDGEWLAADLAAPYR